MRLEIVDCDHVTEAPSHHREAPATQPRAAAMTWKGGVLPKQSKQSGGASRGLPFELSTSSKIPTIRYCWFADSALEGGGFEPSVPYPSGLKGARALCAWSAEMRAHP